jgi:hypothetical protein
VGGACRHARASSSADRQVLLEALVLGGALALFTEAQLKLRPSGREAERIMWLVSRGEGGLVRLVRCVIGAARARGDRGILQRGKAVYQACKAVEDMCAGASEEEEEVEA